MPVLVAIAGPQASGKSTIAAALGRALRDNGDRVAVIELDAIAAMALPTLPGWDTAHGIFEAVTGLWLLADLTVVVAEGSGSAAEVDRLVAAAPADVDVITVALTTDLESAYARALSDPTRGISKQYDFLETVYARWPAELERIDPDLLLDTSRLDVGASLSALVQELDQRRRA